MVRQGHSIPLNLAYFACFHCNFHAQKHFLGNTCNNMVSLTNALWLATTLNSTLILPKYMGKIFQEFNITTLRSSFCFRTIEQHTHESKGRSSRLQYSRTVTGPESFFMFSMFNSPKFKHQLPKFDQKTMMEMSYHYVRVYAALWSSPLEGMLLASKHMIKHHLNNSLDYTTVHKRSMEGMCDEFLNGIAISDYSERELPMKNPEWRNKQKKNPICVMSPSFINDTISMHGRQDNKVLISFDGRGDIKPWTDLGHVLTTVLDKSGANFTVPKIFLDAFLAMNGGFFVLNPRSTFSWQIFIVREILGLHSVPLLTNNDYLIMLKAEYKREKRTGFVVTWLQIAESARLTRLSVS